MAVTQQFMPQAQQVVSTSVQLALDTAALFTGAPVGYQPAPVPGPSDAPAPASGWLTPNGIHADGPALNADPAYNVDASGMPVDPHPPDGSPVVVAPPSASRARPTPWWMWLLIGYVIYLVVEELE